MRAALICSLVLAVGCAKEGEKKPAAAVGARDAGAKAAVPPKRKPADSGVSAPDAQARAFLDRWLKGQNGGDFAAYSALYAPDFQGVRRSGKSVKKFDHDGWLADRKKMFAETMIVSADNPVARAEGDRLTIDFEQTWESGSYADKGPKRIVLAAGLVVSEEMLASTLTVVPSGDCVAAMIPDPGERKQVRDTQVFRPDGSKYQVCVLDQEEGGQGEFRIALLEEKGTSWAVRGKTASFPFTRESKGGTIASAEVIGSLESISDDEEALLVEIDLEERTVKGTSRSVTTRRWTLFRLVDELEPLVEANSSREDDSSVDFETGREIEIAIVDTRTRGYYDVVVRDTWTGPMEEEEPDATYRWDGSKYVAK